MYMYMSGKEGERERGRTGREKLHVSKVFSLSHSLSLYMYVSNIILSLSLHLDGT